MKRYFAVIMFFAVLGISGSCLGQAIKGTYAIKNSSTGMLLRPLDASNKNAAPLVSYSPTNWKCMTWDFRQVEDQTYSLRNLLTGKTFQPAGSEPAEGTALQQQPLQEQASNQQWEFIPAKDNSFLIRLKGTDLYITPTEQGTVNSQIILAKKKPGNLQHWTIYEQHPVMYELIHAADKCTG
ncbi:MAG: RICIN domain-containing protein [Williamsia sp.]|nr:RICIN domain-containing protein [Williamsia sp.]